MNKMLGALVFQGKNLELPTGFRSIAQPARDRYVAMLPPMDRVCIPKLIPPWFKPVLPIAPHQKACDSVGQGFKDLLDTLCDAVVYAHNMWRLQAKFTPLPITGPVVIGPPGCLTGPTLEGFIKQYPPCAAMGPAQSPYRDGCAAGVSQAFMLWQSTVTVPGLPLFPAYSMQPPGPAVPTPCVPQKLIACVSANMSTLCTPTMLKQAMVARFPPNAKIDNPSYDAFFEALATVVALGFLMWLSNQSVMGLTGSGAVASPLGGPVAGITLPTPGHLAT
jgi:hypothetical protein